MTSRLGRENPQMGERRHSDVRTQDHEYPGRDGRVEDGKGVCRGPEDLGVVRDEAGDTRLLRPRRVTERTTRPGAVTGPVPTVEAETVEPRDPGETSEKTTLRTLGRTGRVLGT